MPDERQVFFVTFGQLHPLKDHVVRVLATDEAAAREVINEVLGDGWASLYNVKEMQSKAHYFPKGTVGQTIQGN